MRLEQLTPAHVRRAVEIYLRCAWPEGPPARTATMAESLDGRDKLDDLFACFERVARDDDEGLKRYTLRLGNRRYPFMKFVVQEYLVNGEYFFSVDTHDRLEVRPDSPDYAEWEKLKAWNRTLKSEIEHEFDGAGLPTNTDLRALVEELAHLEREAKKKKRLLLVDDEADVAMGLAALLSARGYDVEVLHDGVQALERLACDPLPDLVLLDFEMPELDGQEVLRCLRSEDRTETLKVLVATASDIELSRIPKASALLRKPYPRQVLFALIGKLLDEA